MNFDKDQIVQLLHSMGNHDQADQATQQLPDQVDTENSEHASLLSRFGLDPSELHNKLGGLGGKLGNVL
jgi:hypothetical protein